MSLNDTPSSERVHIGFFGTANAGKSSLVNAVTGQNMSLVSNVSGTTTDPVRKAMELLPIGPVVIIDTPGMGDYGVLGERRMENTAKVLRAVDVAVLVCDSLKELTEEDKKLLASFKEKKIPFVTVYNKADLLQERKSGLFYVSAKTGEGINKLKEEISHLAPMKSNKICIVDSFVSEGDFVILVTPIDEAAPKGRIILPQQQILRNILDIGAFAMVVQPMQLDLALKSMKIKPKAVITDSQVFGEVSKIVPEDVMLTSFSILLANYKGILNEAVKAVKKIERLSDGDMLLIAEGCTHHRQCNDIGTVKIPAWIKKHTGKDINFEFTSGREFPDDLSKYAAVIHCGGCMITERDVLSRMEKAQSQNIPFTNYGIFIAYINGILKRSIEVFPDMEI